MWFAQDVARHRRALMVELKAEHGPVAVAVDTVLEAHAKEQNDEGRIRDGFASIAQEAGCSKAEARAFIEEAAQIGWLDDLEIDEDGRRFTVRMSGWKADQNRGNAAWRKAKQREREESEEPCDDAGPSVTERDESRFVTPPAPTAQHSTVKSSSNAREDFTTELTGLLRRVPQWANQLDQGADAGVLALVDSHPGVPWLELAAEAVSSRLDTSPGSLRTDSPVQALTLRLNDHRTGKRGPPPKSRDEQAERHAREEAILRGEVA